MMKHSKGITLVALVITIIVLLILAGISIAQLTGNGLFEKAKLAKEVSKNAQEDEEDKIKQYGNEINSYVDGNRDTVTISKDDYEKIKLIPIAFTSPSTNATWTEVASYPEGLNLTNCDVISGYIYHSNGTKYTIPCGNGESWKIIVRMTTKGIELFVNANSDFLGKQGVLYLKKI